MLLGILCYGGILSRSWSLSVISLPRHVCGLLSVSQVILTLEMSLGYMFALQSSNMCLADACGALHCDYFNSLSSEPKKQAAACKPAVVEKNRHSCEVGSST